MPVVFRTKGFRFFFYSNEGNPPEPVHIHVRKGSASAKFWIEPEAGVAHSCGFDPATLNESLRIVENNAELIERAWHEHFG